MNKAFEKQAKKLGQKLTAVAEQVSNVADQTISNVRATQTISQGSTPNTPQAAPMKLFGAPLNLQSEQIPPIILSIVEYFDAHGVGIEGLFRLSGGAGDMKKWMDLFDNGETTFDEDTDVHVIASLLKQYLRLLPQPLIPTEKYQEFVQVGEEVDVAPFIAGVKQLLPTLPINCRVILKYLMGFLQRVSRQSDVNFMTPANISIVFAPNILRPPGDDIFVQMGDSAAANRLITNFVIYWDQVFSDEPDPKIVVKPPIPKKPTNLFEFPSGPPPPPPPKPPVPGEEAPSLPAKPSLTSSQTIAQIPLPTPPPAKATPTATTTPTNATQVPLPTPPAKGSAKSVLKPQATAPANLNSLLSASVATGNSTTPSVSSLPAIPPKPTPPPSMLQATHTVSSPSISLPAPPKKSSDTSTSVKEEKEETPVHHPLSKSLTAVGKDQLMQAMQTLKTNASNESSSSSPHRVPGTLPQLASESSITKPKVVPPRVAPRPESSRPSLDGSPMLNIRPPVAPRPESVRPGVTSSSSDSSSSISRDFPVVSGNASRGRGSPSMVPRAGVKQNTSGLNPAQSPPTSGGNVTPSPRGTPVATPPSPRSASSTDNEESDSSVDSSEGGNDQAQGSGNQSRRGRGAPGGRGGSVRRSNSDAGLKMRVKARPDERTRTDPPEVKNPNVNSTNTSQEVVSPRAAQRQAQTDSPTASNDTTNTNTPPPRGNRPPSNREVLSKKPTLASNSGVAPLAASPSNTSAPDNATSEGAAPRNKPVTPGSGPGTNTEPRGDTPVNKQAPLQTSGESRREGGPSRGPVRPGGEQSRRDASGPRRELPILRKIASNQEGMVSEPVVRPQRGQTENKPPQSQGAPTPVPRNNGSPSGGAARPSESRRELPIPKEPIKAVEKPPASVETPAPVEDASTPRKPLVKPIQQAKPT